MRNFKHVLFTTIIGCSLFGFANSENTVNHYPQMLVRYCNYYVTVNCDQQAKTHLGFNDSDNPAPANPNTSLCYQYNQYIMGGFTDKRTHERCDKYI